MQLLAALGFWLLLFAHCRAADLRTATLEKLALVALTEDLKKLKARSQERFYCVNSAGLPVSRSMRFAIGGWVENSPAKLIPSSG
jgi:hypothetical protein